jgi:hypothetical protein
MNTTSKTLLVALLGLSVSAFATAGFAADEETAAQPQEQVSTTAPETPDTTQPDQATEAATPPAAVEQIEATDLTEYEFVPLNKPADQEKATEEAAKASITGAFGLTLGEKFAPYMVGKVLGQKDMTYKDRDENKTEHTGTQYQVVPNVPNPYFNEYEVLTNKDGIIYSITGKQIPEKPVSSCEQTKQIALFLIDKYGKPRSRGMLGEWFTFREATEGPYKGLRFYAQRCRNGRYSVVYSDDAAMMQSFSETPDVEKGL